MEARAFLANVRRGKIDRDMGWRNVVPAILQRRPYAIPALTDSSVGQTDSVKVILHCLNSRHVDLDLDDAGIDAINRGTQRLIEHGASYEAWSLYFRQMTSFRLAVTREDPATSQAESHPTPCSPEWLVTDVTLSV